jgi:hypothetical protein
VGRPSALMALRLLSNTQQPDPQLRLLHSPLPPLLHVCRHVQGASCLCQVSVLVALDWLLASPPDEDLLRLREGPSRHPHRESRAAWQLARMQTLWTCMVCRQSVCNVMPPSRLHRS